MLNTLSMGKLGDPSLQHSLKLETSKGRLSHFGQDVLVTADSTHAYRIDSGMQLRRIAEYRRPHWSTGFTPDVEHEHLFSIDPAGHLRRWRVEVHRLSREAFADMLKLQYRPRPPSPGVPPRPSHRYPIRGFLSPPVSHSVIRKET